MAINEWKIWKKLGLIKEEAEEIKVKDDLGAVVTFLKEVEVKELIRKLEKMGEMATEEGVIEGELKGDNLEKQIKAFDDILRDYEFFVNDTDINELRLKKVGKELLRKAEALGMKGVVKEKKRDIKWR